MDRSGRTLEDYRELFWEAEKIIKELEADRDDYKARWEATGCTRHGAMETAIALNKKTQAKLDAVKECPRYRDNTYLGINPDPEGEYFFVDDVMEAIGEQK